MDVIENLDQSLNLASTLSTVVDDLIRLGNPIITILISLGLLYFIYGLAQFIFAAGDTAKITEGRKTMLWGIIAIFVMLSVWGLALVLARSFDLDDSRTNENVIIERPLPIN